MGYRSELDAAQARIRTLEAQLKEKNAALEAREAEVDELRRELEHSGVASRKPTGRAHAASYAVATLLSATFLLGGWMSLHWRTRPIEMTTSRPISRTTIATHPTVHDAAVTPKRDARQVPVDGNRCGCAEGDLTCHMRCSNDRRRGKQELGF